MNKRKIDLRKFHSLSFCFRPTAIAIFLGGLITLLALSGCGRHKPERIMQDAQTAFQQRDFVTAMIKLDDFLQRYPEHPLAVEAQFALGRCNMGLGRFDKAIEEYQKVIKKYPASSEVIIGAEFDIAAAYIELGKFTEAVAQYDRMLTTYSKDTLLIPLVRYNKARTFAQQQKWDEAVKGYTELANSAAPQRMVADAYFRIAEIYQQTKKYPQAIATYKTILTKFSKQEQVLLNAYWTFAEMYKESKQYPSAIETYKTITTKFAKLPRLQRAELEFKIADCYKQQKKYKEAVATYQSVQKQYATDPLAQDFATWSNVELGSIHRKELNDLKSAMPYYDSAIKTYTEIMNNPPRDDSGKAAYAAVKLGEIYEHHLGNKAKAIESYQYAVKKLPKAQWTQFAQLGLLRLTQDTTKKTVTVDTTAPKKK
ncbi:MAG: tetratricopeptide repeat protein [bacterium]|nr:tetratricopeptide repeat protein [bacterium]